MASFIKRVFKKKSNKPSREIPSISREDVERPEVVSSEVGRQLEKNKPVIERGPSDELIPEKGECRFEAYISGEPTPTVQCCHFSRISPTRNHKQ
jgi:hypothetical protein